MVSKIFDTRRIAGERGFLKKNMKNFTEEISGKLENYSPTRIIKLRVSLKVKRGEYKRC
jgi:DNA-binding transcriptional regulator YiaG